MCCAENFDAVDKGLQPGRDKLPPSSPNRMVLSAVSAAPNSHVKMSQPPSSHLVHAEHHISLQNSSSQHTDTCEVFAIQDATPKATSLVRDPSDQSQDLPEYLDDFFLHGPGQVGHTSPSALDKLVTSRADWACNHLEPKLLEEAQTKPSVQSVQGSASLQETSWSASCSQPDV